MKIPPIADIELAAEWLRNYEGEPQSGRCRTVARWIESLAREHELRAAAREGGVPVAALRRKVAQQFSNR